MSLFPSNAKPGVFPNMAGRKDCDEILRRELEAAGIPALDRIVPDRGEVPARIFGGLDPLGWSFNRAWYYWIAKGPGIPPSYAAELHRQHGRDVRVDGHCLSPSPLEWCKGFAVGTYHVDTPEGLKALADTIKLVYAETRATLGAQK